MTARPSGDPAIDVSLDRDGTRFVVTVDGAEAGFAEFHRRDGRWIFPHTVIHAEHEGTGLGSVLARSALDHVAEHHERVVPLCWFISGWIERHPEYDHLVDHPATEALRAHPGAE